VLDVESDGRESVDTLVKLVWRVGRGRELNGKELLMTDWKGNSGVLPLTLREYNNVVFPAASRPNKRILFS
jgi:hypothetical protein